MPAQAFGQTQAKNTLVSVVSPVRKKLRIVRWLSSKIGEYDIENDFWTSVDAQVKKPFLPFSRTVYLPNQDMLVLGGLSDEILNKKTDTRFTTVRKLSFRIYHKPKQDSNRFYFIRFYLIITIVFLRLI